LSGLALCLALLCADRAQAQQDVKPESVKGQMYHYKLPVNHQDGIRLLEPDGKPLRASHIRVWAPQVNWTARAGMAAITHPKGEGGMAEKSWRYPGLHILGVVLGNGREYHNVVETGAPGQEFKFNGGADIFTNVNDLVNFYGDNSGSYNLIIEILKR
jgi:hypothetical protein